MAAPPPASSEDILSDALAFLGGDPVVESDDADGIRYGPLRLTVASKAGKANTLLADHLFSPALLLAELVERGEIPTEGRTVLELGAGTGLPSLLLSTRHPPPALVLVTDYPDPGILGNLQANVARNRHLVAPGCTLACAGYEWGADAAHLRALLPPAARAGFSTLLLSDLLHFDDAHPALVASIRALSARTPDARVYIARPLTLRLARAAGLLVDEVLPRAAPTDSAPADPSATQLPQPAPSTPSQPTAAPAARCTPFLHPTPSSPSPSPSSSSSSSSSHPSHPTPPSPTSPPHPPPQPPTPPMPTLHPVWLGTLEVGGLDAGGLALRKAACRLWVARWGAGELARGG
ncbi:hypothetical protein HDZ31DRAFT_62600 [Schizophyllum fasciatum]